jgi:hypothetical protein
MVATRSQGQLENPNMTNVPTIQLENTNQPSIGNNDTEETPTRSLVFGPQLPPSKRLGIVEFQLEHMSETMELLLQRSYKNSNQNRNSTDGGAHLETTSGPHGPPATKEDGTTSSARMDAFIVTKIIN